MSVAAAIEAHETAKLPVIASIDAALAVARQMGPKIRSLANDTEANRIVSKDIVAEMKNSGLFSLTTPKEFGGAEMGFSAVVQVTAELARYCGSTGWVFGVLAGHSWLLNYFPKDVQKEVYGDGTRLTATVFRLGGKAVQEPGGIRITEGVGRFCSGIDHADWVVVGATVEMLDGSVAPHFAIVSKKNLEVQDDWFTAGMRGTGSRTIHIRDALVPNGWAVPFSKMNEAGAKVAKALGKEVYAIPWTAILPFSLIGAPMGMARGALQAFIDGLKGRVQSFNPQQQAEQSATFERLAAAATDIDAALALVVADADYCDSIADASAMTPVKCARISANWAWAAQTSRYAATRLFEAGGGSGIYNNSEIQRFWRDVNSAAQHIAFTWDSSMTSYGRSLLDLPANQYGVKGR